MAIKTFERVEQKYLINQSLRDSLIQILFQYMELDSYCLNQSTYKIRNIYLDTPDSYLIRNSLFKPEYKEKLRLRKYDNQAGVFIEIKKKYKGVVSKRRCEISEEEFDRWIYDHVKPSKESYLSKQIIEEIDYLLKTYHVDKKVYIAYDRLGFFDTSNKELRVTFDSNLRYKKDDVSWLDENTINIIPTDKYVMEIKNNCGLPIWLVQALDQLGIRKSSFSKYGTQYLNQIKEINEYVR